MIAFLVSPGQEVLLTQWTGSPPDEVWAQQEIATIATISEDTSLTMVEDLLHTYTGSGYVYPLAVAVTDIGTNAGGQASDEVAAYPAPDRRLKL